MRFNPGMESEESIDFVDSEDVNTYVSVVAKEEPEDSCELSEECEDVDPPRFNSYNIEVCHPCWTGTRVS